MVIETGMGVTDTCSKEVYLLINYSKGLGSVVMHFLQQFMCV